MSRGARFTVKFAPETEEENQEYNGASDWIVLQFSERAFEQLCKQVEIYKALDEEFKKSGKYNSNEIKGFYFDVNAEHPTVVDMEGNTTRVPSLLRE